MNYKIIYNEDKLKEFVDWLPDLLPNEQYYISLLARKKYNTETGLTNDKNQLKRVTATKDRIIQKIKQMECEIGSYTYKDIPISQDNLCIYITPNPRDLNKSGLMLLKEIATKVSNNDTNYNPHSLAMSCIQTTCSRRIYFDLDIDFKVPFNEVIDEFYDKVTSVINRNCLTFIRTNGGLHCLIELSKVDVEYEKNWYKNIFNLKCDKFDVTMNSDNIVPIIGCVQGIDFSPNFYNLELIYT